MSRQATTNVKLVADYFLLKGQTDKKPISNKKLQKLLYYAQAWSLVIRDHKLFGDKIEAWVHGPAVRQIYLEYKKFGWNPIEKKIDTEEFKNLSSDVVELLDEVWNVYGKLDAGYLELLTHSEKPWQDARNGLEGSENSENQISLKSMKEFYSKKLEEVKS